MPENEETITLKIAVDAQEAAQQVANISRSLKEDLGGAISNVNDSQKNLTGSINEGTNALTGFIGKFVGIGAVVQILETVLGSVSRIRDAIRESENALSSMNNSARSSYDVWKDVIVNSGLKDPQQIRAFQTQVEDATRNANLTQQEGVAGFQATEGLNPFKAGTEEYSQFGVSAAVDIRQSQLSIQAYRQLSESMPGASSNQISRSAMQLSSMAGTGERGSELESLIAENANLGIPRDTILSMYQNYRSSGMGHDAAIKSIRGVLRGAPQEMKKRHMSGSQISDMIKTPEGRQHLERQFSGRAFVGISGLSGTLDSSSLPNVDAASIPQEDAQVSESASSYRNQLGGRQPINTQREDYQSALQQRLQRALANHEISWKTSRQSDINHQLQKGGSLMGILTDDELDEVNQMMYSEDIQDLTKEAFKLSKNDPRRQKLFDMAGRLQGDAARKTQDDTLLESMTPSGRDDIYMQEGQGLRDLNEARKLLQKAPYGGSPKPTTKPSAINYNVYYGIPYGDYGKPQEMQGNLNVNGDNA